MSYEHLSQMADTKFSAAAHRYKIWMGIANTLSDLDLGQVSVGIGSKADERRSGYGGWLFEVSLAGNDIYTIYYQGEDNYVLNGETGKTFDEMIEIITEYLRYQVQQANTDPLYKLSKAAKEMLDGCLKRPEMYATTKGELVAVVWTTMHMLASTHGCPEIVRETRANVFPGVQRISVRHSSLTFREFTEVLKPWVREFYSNLERRNETS